MNWACALAPIAEVRIINIFLGDGTDDKMSDVHGSSVG
jgi:hypothetical protein